MHSYELLFLLAATFQPSAAFPKLTGNDPLGLRASLARLWPRYNAKYPELATNPNGSTFLWLPQDEYAGKTFFECVIQ
jgi:hypothetical protein